MSLQNKNFIVSVRKRPLFIQGKFEKNNYGKQQISNSDDIITTTPSTVSIHEILQKVNLDQYEAIRTFKFDHVFSDSSNNLSIYRTLLKKRIENMHNTICYTFGETGSGKTHTLFGKNAELTREFGLIEATLYDLLKKTKIANITAFEIYNNKLYDLLSANFSIVEMYEKCGNVHVVGLCTFVCTADTVDKFIKTIMTNRKVGSSSENDRSSRSHVVIKIIADQTNLIFVDVAGCERGNYLRIAQDIQNEMININRDNFALKECMRSMLHVNKNKQHIPFRLSKITMALKESFYDNYNTVIVTTINPSKSNVNTTLNILSYVNDFRQYAKLPKPIPLLLEPIIQVKPPTAPKKPHLHQGRYISPNPQQRLQTPNKFVRERALSDPPVFQAPPKSAKRSDVSPCQRRIIRSVSTNRATERNIVNDLIKLVDEEKYIYNDYLTNKNNNKSLPELYGNKLESLKSEQINLLDKIGVFAQKK